MIEKPPFSAHRLSKNTDLSDVKILVVDESPVTVDLLTLFLEEAGANVVSASNGANGASRAVEAIYAGSAFDLILMDMRMPGMAGCDATRRIRDEGIDCPVVALTAFAMKDDEQACLSAGCNTYLSKPIDLCAMFKTIEQQLPHVIPRPQSGSGVRLKSLFSNKTADVRFQPILKKYLARLPGMLDQIQTARSEGDRDALLSVVHRLQGTAASYGFPQISAVAEQCERALRVDPTTATPASQSAIRYTGSHFCRLATGCVQRNTKTTSIEQGTSASLDLLTSLLDSAIESFQSHEYQ